MGKLAQFCNLLVEPIEVTGVPLEDKDLFMGGPDNSFPFGNQLLMEWSFSPGRSPTFADIKPGFREI